MSVGLRLRIYILRRDGYRCVYCGAEPRRSYLEIDHVIPRKLGGATHPSNLVTACRPCNNGKRATQLVLPAWLERKLAAEASFDWQTLRGFA